MRALTPFALLAASWAVACGPDAGLPLGQLGAPIVNGELDEGHAAVGGFRTSLGGSCTATLIGEKTVLTAAHCISPSARHTFVLLDRDWAVAKVIPHPRYTNPDIKNDVAVALLREAPGVRPAAITARPPEVGQTLTLVGIGETGDDSGAAGFKRIATNTLAVMDDAVLTYYGAEGEVGNVCFGDSGGPTFATINGQEVQVGVHSYIQGECGSEGNDMRVDVLTDWIVEQAGGDVRVGGNPDTAPPSVAFVRPDLAQPLYPAVELEVAAEDDVGIDEVVLFVDDVTMGRSISRPFVFTLGLEPGSHALRALATDLAGKSAEAGATIEILPFKALGEPCASATECETPICQSHPALAAGYCTRRCRPESPCPDGLACVATTSDYVCAPPAELLDPGGCGVAHGPSAALALVPLLLLLLWRRARSR